MMIQKEQSVAYRSCRILAKPAAQPHWKLRLDCVNIATDLALGRIAKLWHVG